MQTGLRQAILVTGLVGLAGTALPQWHHFGEKTTPVAPPAQVAPPAPVAPPTPTPPPPVQARVAAPPAVPALAPVVVKPALSLMASEMIAVHNAVRARTGIPDLAWSEHLASVAAEWADKLSLSGQFVHSHNPHYGENLYEITGAAAMPVDVVNAWAGEVTDYNYASNTCHGVCGHYTQIVWNDTKEVGCAVARRDHREVWVCEYNPPGNYVGRKPY